MNNWDDFEYLIPRLRANPKGSRRRTRQRPTFDNTIDGFVSGVDRGRFTVALSRQTIGHIVKNGNIKDNPRYIYAVKARELKRRGVLVGDFVNLQGVHLSNLKNPDLMARIVEIQPRQNELKRSTETSTNTITSSAIAANLNLVLIITSITAPTPSVGLIDRILAAASASKIPSALCVTKCDLLESHINGEKELQNLIDYYQPFSIPIFKIADSPPKIENEQAKAVGKESDVQCLAENLQKWDFDKLNSYLANKTTVLIGHSGVGKSTLINRLIPNAKRTTGHVNNATGKGRHTSTSAIAFPLPTSPKKAALENTKKPNIEADTDDITGWIIDTPGIRSFGVSHLAQNEVLETFPNMAEAATQCMPGCTHSSSEPNCALNKWAQGNLVRQNHLKSARVLLSETALKY